MDINFKNLSNTKPNIPEVWIYKNYLNLEKQAFIGETIKLRSVINRDTNPSTFIYVDQKSKKYKWKDHSSGESGDAYDIVKLLLEQSSGEEVPFKVVFETVKKDYQKWVEINGEFQNEEIEVNLSDYNLVAEYEIQDFTIVQLDYWDKIGVSEDLLKRENVKSLKWFEYGKKYATHTQMFGKKSFTHSFGYFNAHNELIQIYNPFESHLKFITLKRNSYLGANTLSVKCKTLIIAASGKDRLCLLSLYLDIAVIAVLGENTLLDNILIEDLKNIYKNVYVLFDNDKSGIRSMLKYKALYNIDYVYVPYNKDLADFRKASNYYDFKHKIIELINKKLCKPIYNEVDH